MYVFLVVIVYLILSNVRFSFSVWSSILRPGRKETLITVYLLTQRLRPHCPNNPCFDK